MAEEAHRNDTAELPKKKTPMKGHDWKLLLKRALGEPYSCGVCHFLCRDAVELTCPADKHSTGNSEEDESSDSDDENPSARVNVYCQSCMEQYVSEHKKCPLNDHEDPQYRESITARQVIGRLKVTCPLTLKEKDSPRLVWCPCPVSRAVR